MFNPSPQQSSIFDSIRLGSSGSNLIVDAKAGSGKTTTIVEGLKHIPMENEYLKPSVAFLAFNKSIAEALKSRCPSWVQSTTFHALGFRALKNSNIVERNVKVDGGKCRRLVWNAVDRDNPDTKDIIRLVSMCKSVPEEHPDKEQLRVAIAHYGMSLEEPEYAINVALAVLDASNRDTNVIDFDDMLYLAVIRNARFDKQDWVFVDEAQDTNDIQLEILERLMKPPQIRRVGLEHTWPEEQTVQIIGRSSSRLIAVGDPHQAIYGFRGANADSMDRIAARFQCETLPLSVSYRCPKAVVAEAQKYLK